MPKNMKTIATVQSFSHNFETYTVVQNSGHWQCTCRDWFFRRQPCKHIRAIRQLRQVPVGEMTLKKVKLTEWGEGALERWRTKHDMPLVRPEDYAPEAKNDPVLYLR